MGRVTMGGAVSLDGYIAARDDSVGPLFDWYSNGDVPLILGDPDRPFRVSAASAAHLRAEWLRVRALVIGRRLFDYSSGWGGVPAIGEHVFVVTHTPPTDWAYPDAPFTFVPDGVGNAVARAREFAGDGDVSVTAGDVGGQALQAGLIDEVHYDLVPVVLGSGRPFFGTVTDGPLMLDNPGSSYPATGSCTSSIPSADHPVRAAEQVLEGGGRRTRCRSRAAAAATNSSSRGSRMFVAGHRDTARCVRRPSQSS